ncbi:hypothetical protein ElyMa_003384600 [Elysia marginata]|uniref:Uncharacterized protein n=1 Tax=Elysia marginata TaxID=1093978 RepID=A0AAV4JMA9_9GAST|nr:hypothetical protein ElyMa_003384600 [Elysia marginata]
MLSIWSSHTHKQFLSYNSFKQDSTGYSMFGREPKLHFDYNSHAVFKVSRADYYQREEREELGLYDECVEDSTQATGINMKCCAKHARGPSAMFPARYHYIFFI